MRYRVTVEFLVDAYSNNEAQGKGQKLADVLNKKDPKSKAWVPKMVKNPDSERKDKSSGIKRRT